MYESRHQKLAHPHVFYRRMAMHALVAVAVLAASLGIGMVGYVCLEGLTWMEAFLDAAMLLGGMGPVHKPVTDAGRLFAGLYALYAGLVILVMAAVVITPLGHRVLHRFHWNEKDE